MSGNKSNRPEASQSVQRWIGDLVDVGGRFVGNRVKVPMSTAIVRTYTADGFVVAADGRSCDAVDGEVVSDEVQKIFPIGGGTPFLACSISGTAQISSKVQADSRVLDFTKEFRRYTQSISVQRCATLADFARRCCQPIYRELEQAKRSGWLEYPEPESQDAAERGSTICRIFIDGYFKGIPARVKVRFFHELQMLGDLEVFAQELTPDDQWVQGPAAITDLFFDKRDLGTFPYETESEKLFHDCRSKTLRNYSRKAHCYISLCKAPDWKHLAPKICAGIGGHIHVATITPRNGFEWLLPPVGISHRSPV